MLAVAQPEQADADQGPSGQVERTPRLLDGEPPGLGLAPIGGQVPQIGQPEREFQRRGDDLDRPPVDLGERGPERLVATGDLGEAPPERIQIERTADPQGARDVLGRLTGRQLVEEPEGLLGKREGDRALTIRGPDRRRSRPLGHLAGGLDPTG